MDGSIVARLRRSFESCVHELDGVEFWFARELQTLLGYDKWDNFARVIDKAKDSCRNAGFEVDDHFPGARKTIPLPKGANREIDDYALTRYACYLIAQNGDPRKVEIAFAQSYFAVQTRKQELIEQRILLQERFQARSRLLNSETELSKLIYERGVDDSGFARIRSKGDEALFGGYDTKRMKSKLNIPLNRPLADFLPTVTIAAKNLATELTNFNVKQSDLWGEVKITDENIKNNVEMRNVLAKNNIIPEDLPAEEDIRKLQRRLRKEDELLADAAKINDKR